MLFILFVKQKMRLSFVVRVENAVPCPPETRFGPHGCHGLRYSWAEFENYFDAETAGATKHAISKNDYRSSSDRRSQTMFSYLPIIDLGSSLSCSTI
jgi:hypothetical protein